MTPDAATANVCSRAEVGTDDTSRAANSMGTSTAAATTPHPSTNMAMMIMMVRLVPAPPPSTDERRWLW